MDFIFPLEQVSLPIVGNEKRFPVRRIYCVGRNYLDHIRETAGADEREPPFFFQKPADAIVESGGEFPYPPQSEKTHHEIELVVAIGTGELFELYSRNYLFKEFWGLIIVVFAFAVSEIVARVERRTEHWASAR